MKLNYQYQDSTQTLEEALTEYKNANQEILNYDNQRENKFFFIPHDVCHVLFSCNTGLSDEAITDVWTIFGTNVSLIKFWEFTRLESHQKIIKEVGLSGVICTFLLVFPRIMIVIFYSLNMRKKWKWEDHEKYLNSPLYKIREEFNIKIV